MITNMNVTFLRVKGIVRELARVANACERLAACWEAELAEQGLHIRPPKADMSGPEPELTYVDEEADALAELEEKLGIRKKEPEFSED